jgi:hypothetical protein
VKDTFSQELEQLAEKWKKDPINVSLVAEALHMLGFCFSPRMAEKRRGAEAR